MPYNKTMRLLLTNDDGIYAHGLQTLARILAPHHHVTVVAPDRERSATGHALTLHIPLRVEPKDLGLGEAAAYAVSGTPSDCVKLALHALMQPENELAPPDMVISGINHGPNLGHDVVYSGTVSAALEGALMGVPSVAVSLANGYDRQADFAPGAEFILDYLPHISPATSGVLFPRNTILNINLPAASKASMYPDVPQGVRMTRLGTRIYSDTYEKRFDPRQHVYYWLAGEVIETPNLDEPDADIVALRQHLVSVTPVRLDLCHEAFMEQYRDTIERLPTARPS
jgi:5'-nucleotidase